jgi:hypothetical protein
MVEDKLSSLWPIKARPENTHYIQRIKGLLKLNRRIKETCPALAVFHTTHLLFGGTRVWTQGFILARQVPYHLRQAPNPSVAEITCVSHHTKWSDLISLCCPSWLWTLLGSSNAPDSASQEDGITDMWPLTWQHACVIHTLSGWGTECSIPLSSATWSLARPQSRCHPGLWSPQVSPHTAPVSKFTHMPAGRN